MGFIMGFKKRVIASTLGCVTISFSLFFAACGDDSSSSSSGNNNAGPITEGVAPAFLKKGDKVWSTFVDGFRSGYIVKEIDAKTGHMWVQREGSSSMDCKSLAEVTKVLD